MRKILYLFPLLLLLGCKDSVFYNVDKLSPDGILINKWRVVGPFKNDTLANNFETRYLEKLGYDESTLDYTDFEDINSKSDTSFKNIIAISPDHKIDFNKIFNRPESHQIKGVAYAGCVIKSTDKQSLKLNFSSNEGIKIWLNNKLVFSDEKGEALRIYENYIDLNLNKGSNFLLIRVSNLQNPCEVFAAIEKESKEGLKRHEQNFLLDFGNSFLYRNVIENDSIKLIWEMPKGKYKLDLAGPEKASYQIKTDEFINISHLPDGLYTTKFYARGNTFDSRFYKGDIISKIDQLIKRIKVHPSYKKDNTINALEFRFKHLTKLENIGKESYEKRAWGKKMTSLLINLNIQYDVLNKRIKPGEAVGGLLRSYVSEIDNGIQYYQLHVPINYNPEKPTAMVIELPKFMKRFESPLQSFRFANIDLFEQFTDLANKYNMIVLDPGNRIIDRQNQNGIDEADLWEAIKDVRKDFNIDTARMFLRGACLSSHSALNLAVRYPDRFAAISTIAPQFTIPVENNIWLQQNLPLNFLSNITNLPFYNIHSEIDPHSPVKVSKQLNEDVKKAGLTRYYYKKLPMEFKTFYSEEHLDDIFRFFSSLRSSQAPKHINFATNQLKYNKSFWITLNTIYNGKKALIDARIQNNVLKIHRENVISYSVDLKKLPYNKKAHLTIIDNDTVLEVSSNNSEKIFTVCKDLSNTQKFKNKETEGPFAHVFTTSFIVVPGTSGDKEETAKIKSIMDTLNKYWTNRYYSSFHIKSDKDLTIYDIKRSNIILIGSPKSNSVFKSLLGRLPLKVNVNSVVIGDKKLTGNRLNYYFVYPNPNNPKKYVAILGYNNHADFSLTTEENLNEAFNDISDYGWYDYKIWAPSSTGKNIHGYFNYNWK